MRLHFTMVWMHAMDNLYFFLTWHVPPIFMHISVCMALECVRVHCDFIWYIQSEARKSCDYRPVLRIFFFRRPVVFDPAVENVVTPHKLHLVCVVGEYWHMAHIKVFTDSALFVAQQKLSYYNGLFKSFGHRFVQPQKTRCASLGARKVKSAGHGK